MTNEQLEHVEHIKSQFNFHMTEKYKRGQREHGGNLWELSERALLENAIDEAIDQVVYLITLHNKMVKKS